MLRTYHTAAGRWAGVGPYYAMFPVAFADEVVRTYTRPGDLVLDPFAGRGTAIFSAAVHDRSAVGIEINPVGYVYAKAKLHAATQDEVEARLYSLGESATVTKEEALQLPHFFHRCFSARVRTFLAAARTELNWRYNRVDWTLMALLLVCLHGKMGSALSNQMRQTKSMSPQYAIRWWDKHNFHPPDIDPVAFIKKRLVWRYARGIPKTSCGRIYLANSIEKLAELHQEVTEGSLARTSLLFTSPPYYAVTNYHYDQWLRLWLLGGSPTPVSNGDGWRGKFESREGYRQLLTQVFARAAKLLKEDAFIYIRTDIREYTYRTTLAVLRQIFPDKCLKEIRRPLLKPSQTRLFGAKGTPTKANGEVDLILGP